MPLHLKIGGTWKSATPYVKIGGVWKDAQAFVRAGGVWKAVAQLAATASPSTIAGSGNTSIITTSQNATATATGGVGPFTYAWTRGSTIGDIQAVSPSAASTVFRATGIGPGATWDAIFICTVTDTATGQTVATNSVDVAIDRTS